MEPTGSARREQLLVVTAVGNDHTGAVQSISRIILECGANIRESRMTALGAEFAMLLLVAGNWHSISRLEQDLGRYAGSEDLSIHVRRTSAMEYNKELLPYAIDVVCLDQPGIVHHLSGFFAERKIGIAEVTTRSYPAVHTGTPMFSVQMFVSIPADIHISGIREEFMEFCDRLNLDAIMEPVKTA